jgi:hypothetical protein
MKLVENWRAVLTRAWSVRVTALNAALGYAVYAIPYLQDYVSPTTFAAIMATIAVLTIVVRVIPQKKVNPDADQ